MVSADEVLESMTTGGIYIWERQRCSPLIATQGHVASLGPLLLRYKSERASHIPCGGELYARHRI